MTIQLKFAADMRDHAEIARFRREIRDMNLERSGHDPDAQADTRSDAQRLCAWSDGRVIGSLDVHWGGDRPLPAERSALLAVAETLGAHGDPKNAVVLDEAVVHPDWQVTGVDMDLKHGAVRYAAYRRARWVFTTCVPQDIATHRAVGFKPNGLPTSTMGGGTRVPMLLDLLDVDYLTRLKSPFVPLARQLRATRPDEDGPVPSGAAGDADRWKELSKASADSQKLHASFLSGLSSATKTRLLSDGQYLKPALGTTLVKQGDHGRELFLIIRGVVEARRDGKRVAVLGPGEVFGEIGFLLETERTADVVAVTADAVVVKITHEALTRLMQDQPEVAASLAIAIAQGLCLKLMAQH